MVTNRLLLIVAVALCMGPCRAIAQTNFADCFWLIGDTPGPFGSDNHFVIRVTYISGHTSTHGYGDYLPVGCNVTGYQLASPAAAQPAMTLYPPECATQEGAIAINHPGGAVSGGAVWRSINSSPIVNYLDCDSECPSCGADPGNPNNLPLPGDHPDPNDDDDGDGVRNECDPDEVNCQDADNDGCCDHCEDEGCGIADDNDEDNDGIPDECDADETPCYDEDENGCCDHCTPEQCAGEDEDDDEDDDQDEDGDGIRDCDTGTTEDCCSEGDPDHDGDGVCDECDPDYGQAECDTDDDGICDACEVESECDVCDKFDKLLEALEEITEAEAIPHEEWEQQNTAPESDLSWRNLQALPGVTWNAPGGFTFPTTIPVPGTSGVQVHLNRLTDVSGSTALASNFTNFRYALRAIIHAFFAYRFLMALYRLVAQL